MSKFLSSFIHAWRGVVHTFQQERNFQIKILAAIFVLLGVFYFNLSPIEVVVLLIFVGLVLTLELVNTAVEHLVDLIEPKFHEQAKIVKDAMAGAVLMISFFSAIVGFIIFYNPVLNLLS
jgi:undecaprenol kinase